MKRWTATWLLALTTLAGAAPGPCDEAADARADVRAAQAAAAQAKVPVLLVFGAIGCGDCKVLDLAFKEGASAPLIARHFKVVEGDVGKFNRNLDIAEACGVAARGR